MTTGKHLRIQNYGTNAMGVSLEGDPRKPEPESFRVEFPGGQVDIERCTDGSYWVHVIAHTKERTIDREGPDSGTVYGCMSDARLHIEGRNTSEVNFGDFAAPGVYDVAVKVVRA